MKHLLIYSLLISTSCTLIGMNKQPNIYALAKTALCAYKQYIVTTLPHEICKQIDNNCALLDAKIIRESCIETFFEKGEPCDTNHTPKLMISNNGLYFTHDIRYSPNDLTPQLLDIQNKKLLYEFRGRNKYACFSPNSLYYVINALAGVYLFNIIKCEQQCLIENHDPHGPLCYGITISNDSKHILLESRKYGSKEKYDLWSHGKNNTLYKSYLKNDLLYSKAVAFHPNSRQIVYSGYKDELHLVDIGTNQSKQITSITNKPISYIDNLLFTSDSTKILAHTRHAIFGGPEGHILFDITDLDNVTSITLPQQSCYQKKELPMLCIPNKKMLTHITNDGRTLQLINENTQLIASHHAHKNSYISALAVDSTGNYLASGYSDGTIMIWNLCAPEPHNYEKIICKSNGTIQSLTFGTNQLLLSHSHQEYFNTHTPSNAILWDVYGNEVINFHDDIIATVMSQNGKNIITVALELDWDAHQMFPDWKHIVTLSAWNIRNKQTKQLFKERKNSLTLSQMFILNAQQKKNMLS